MSTFGSIAAQPLSRRRVLLGLGSLAATLAIPRLGLCSDRPASPFPRSFVWGVAASAPQTESSAGRGESVWDVFAAKPGAIVDGSNMAVTTAFDTRFPDDLDLVAGAGLRAFRFSFAWPRLQPEGRGRPDPRGLDLYERIVDAMLARGIEPWATAFHWDIPAPLGDWRSRDLAFRYADYAELLARHFGDRVHRWMALNEPGVVALMGYGFGNHAPGLRSREATLAATHHQNLAQGLGIRALRQNLAGSARIGTALSLCPIHPARGDPANAVAAAALDASWNRAFLDPLLGRPYPAQLAGAIEPFVQANDLHTIAAAPDFIGVNYYSRLYAEGDAASPFGAWTGEAPAHLQRTALGWAIEPDGLEELLATLRRDYANIPVVVSEFGASFDDPPPTEGIVADPRRIDFIRQHLGAIERALAQGSRVEGAFYWSATDNWEWGFGFTQHFGLIQVERETLRRFAKSSLAYFGACAQQNSVL